MVEGKLEFFLNGKSMGIAFEDEALREGVLYPACAVMQGKDLIRLKTIKEDWKIIQLFTFLIKDLIKILKITFKIVCFILN